MNGKRLRLGLVGPLPPPSGGMAMQTLQLARLLGEEGIDIELIQTNAPYRPRLVERLRGVRALFRLLPYLFRVWRMAGRVDVVHLMANSGWSWQLFAAPVVWLAWLRSTPVIVNYRGGEAREYLSASVARVRPTLSRATDLVVPSGFLRQVFGDFGFEASIIPNIIDLGTFGPAPAPSGPGRFTFAITRNLERIYGLDCALRALALARQTNDQLYMEIAGSGPLLAQLQSLARQLGVDGAVAFLGRLEKADVVALYHRADAMLNPSRVDNMPNSVLEGLACGLPVVSTRVGGVPFIVEHERSALLVDADDVAGMAAAMLRLQSDSDLYTRLRSRGLELAETYSWEAIRPLWLGLYRERARAA